MIHERMIKNREIEYALSVIIPVFNAEIYISDCLESVLKQDYESCVEIICVNDGSTDGTINIIEKYASTNANIRCISKKHEGAGSARNAGLTKATGKYVSFLDADDYYEDGAVARIYSACKESNEKIIGFAFWKLLDNHEIRETKVIDFADDQKYQEEGKTVFFREWQNDYGYTNFIFERDFLTKNGIKFPAYMRYEDPVFLLNAMCVAGSFRLIPSSIYICRVGYKDSSELDRTINDILLGIRDNLVVAYENEFHNLRRLLLQRIDEEYYETIIRNLSDEVMGILLEINEVNNRFKQETELLILQDVYKGKSGEKIAERNYDREQAVIRDYRIFNNVTKCMKQAGGFSAFLEQNGIKKVCVYGAGLYGRLLVQDFILHGMEVVSVVDKCEEGDVEGIPIIRPDKEKMEYDLLIIALRDASNVEAEYRQKRAQKMISLSKLTDMMILNQFAPGEF